METNLLFCCSVVSLYTVSTPWTSGHMQSVPWLDPGPALPAPPDKECRSAPLSQAGSSLAGAQAQCTALCAPYRSWRNQQTRINESSQSEDHMCTSVNKTNIWVQGSPSIFARQTEFFRTDTQINQKINKNFLHIVIKGVVFISCFNSGDHKKICFWSSKFCIFSRGLNWAALCWI